LPSLRSIKPGFTAANIHISFFSFLYLRSCAGEIDQLFAGELAGAADGFRLLPDSPYSAVF
jgi:hypothetical protein